MNNNRIFTFKKKDGKVVPASSEIAKDFNNYFKDHKDGQRFDVYFEIKDVKGSIAQLARIHASIRKLAVETGCTFEEMKLAIKDKAGLVIRNDERIDALSFGDCSKDDLMLVIETINELGRGFGIIF